MDHSLLLKTSANLVRQCYFSPGWEDLYTTIRCHDFFLNGYLALSGEHHANSRWLLIEHHQIFQVDQCVAKQKKIVISYFPDSWTPMRVITFHDLSKTDEISTLLSNKFCKEYLFLNAFTVWQLLPRTGWSTTLFFYLNYKQKGA
jgi:hypothetical protein